MRYFIDPKACYTYFNSHFDLKKSSQGWWSFKCPFCGDLEDKKKMAVNFMYGYTKCWVCGYKESVIDFIVDYEGVKVSEAKHILYNTKPTNINFEALTDTKVTLYSDIVLPEGYNSILEGKGIMADRARQYLSDRNFSLRELDRMGIGYCFHDKDDLEEDEDYFGYIIIPFKENGKLVYFIGRDYIGNFLRYKNPAKKAFGVGKADLVFNGDALNIFDEIYIAEGWADALTMGRTGIATMGWSLSRTQRSKILKSSCERLVFIPDAGSDNTNETFYQKAVKTAMDFIDHKEVMVLDLNLLSDDGKDANEIGKEEILRLKKETDILTIGKATEILMQ